jgi:L-aspartate oxidase
LQRTESRGSHWRSDFPNKSDKWESRVIESVDKDGKWESKLEPVK